jgi:RNA polymerase sigma factor (sigma-70 family)
MNKSVEQSQAPILPRVARGDQEATRECIDRFGGLVWSIAKRLMIPPAQIEDAVQDVFVEVWKNAGRYDATIASESTFVAVIARRRLIDLVRKLNRQTDTAPFSESVERDAKAGGWRGTSGAEFSRDQPSDSEEARNAAKALDQLSIEQQRVLRLSIFRGLSHDVIAQVLSMPLGTVKTHARRGLIRMRELLSNPAATGSAKGSTASSALAPDVSKGGAP